MHQTIRVFPKPGDEPRARLSPSSGPAIPVIELDGNGRCDAILHFDPTDYDAAVTYLDHLAAEASSLAAKIRVAQRHAQRQAALLAEVQATEHDPQAAAQIRAEYADEAVTS